MSNVNIYKAIVYIYIYIYVLLLHCLLSLSNIGTRIELNCCHGAVFSSSNEAQVSIHVYIFPLFCLWMCIKKRWVRMNACNASWNECVSTFFRSEDVKWKEITWNFFKTNCKCEIKGVKFVLNYETTRSFIRKWLLLNWKVNFKEVD